MIGGMILGLVIGMFIGVVLTSCIISGSDADRCSECMYRNRR